MNLREKLENVSDLLARHSVIEKKPSLSRSITALNRALDDLLTRAEPEMLRDTREYAELSALVGLPENRGVVTNDWYTAHAASVGLKYARINRREREEVLLELVKTKKADAVITELKTTPQQRAQNLLSELANMSPEKAEKKIRGMRPAESVREFAEHNQIQIEKNRRGNFDRARTQANVLNKLAELREYLKM